MLKELRRVMQTVSVAVRVLMLFTGMALAVMVGLVLKLSWGALDGLTMMFATVVGGLAFLLLLIAL